MMSRALPHPVKQVRARPKCAHHARCGLIEHLADNMGEQMAFELEVDDAIDMRLVRKPAWVSREPNQSCHTSSMRFTLLIQILSLLLRPRPVSAEARRLCRGGSARFYAVIDHLAK
ncbi:MAG: hypothetical protein QOG73_1431 [Acetobacteraceae bacterium]|nr:hypothetical protein [Acetobacteraceae bacterium]